MKLIDTNLLIYSQHTELNFLKHLLFTGVNENAISAITKLWVSLNHNKTEDVENPLKSRQQFKNK